MAKKDNRRKTINPATGRPVFITGAIGRTVTAVRRKKQSKTQSKTTQKKKKTATTVIFQRQSAMLSAQDMLDAGFEPGKVIAKCAWNKTKKVLALRKDDTPYWSTKRA